MSRRCSPVVHLGPLEAQMAEIGRYSLNQLEIRQLAASRHVTWITFWSCHTILGRIVQKLSSSMSATATPMQVSKPTHRAAVGIIFGVESFEGKTA